MGSTIRHFLFTEDGKIWRIPRRIVEALTFGKDAIPAYAGTTQRVLEVLIENEDGKPALIESATGFYYGFDADGRIHRSLQRGVGEIMSFAFGSGGEHDNIVPLSKRRAKKEWHDANRWQPTPRDLDRVLADVIRKPGTEPLPSVDSLAKRRPPLSYEAKSVIDELRSSHSMWNWQIRQLSEKSLPGFIWEAMAQAEREPGDQFIWEAVAAEGHRQRELKRLRRTGKGQWVAVVQIFTHENHASSTETFVEHRECEGEKAAIEMMKAMIIEHHGMLGPAMSIEAQTMPALEWKLQNGAPH